MEPLAIISDGWLGCDESADIPLSLISGGWIVPEYQEPEYQEPEYQEPESSSSQSSVIGGARPFHPFRQFFRPSQGDPFSIIAERIASAIESDDEQLRMRADKAVVKASDRIALVAEDIDDPIHAAILSLGRALEGDN